MWQLPRLVQPPGDKTHMIAPVTFDTPVLGPEMGLEPGWIDYNDHLNMAYYNVIFDRSLDAMLDSVGIGEDYRLNDNFTIMTAQAHVSYLRELRSDARVRVTIRLVDADEKRLHIYEELYHSEGWLAATSESILLHVDMAQRKVVRFPDDRLASLGAMLAAHQALPPTKFMGRTLGLKRD